MRHIIHRSLDKMVPVNRYGDHTPSINSLKKCMLMKSC